MSVTTPVKTPRTVVASTSNAAGATTRGTLDLRTKVGGYLTLKLTNGATGPTVACGCNILIAHDSGATPTAGSAGSVWKTIQTFLGSITANAIVERSFLVDPSIMHLEVEFTGNTGQAVTVEAIMSEVTSYDTV